MAMQAQTGGLDLGQAWRDMQPPETPYTGPGLNLSEAWRQRPGQFVGPPAELQIAPDDPRRMWWRERMPPGWQDNAVTGDQVSAMLRDAPAETAALNFLAAEKAKQQEALEALAATHPSEAKPNGPNGLGDVVEPEVLEPGAWLKRNFPDVAKSGGAKRKDLRRIRAAYDSYLQVQRARKSDSLQYAQENRLRAEARAVQPPRSIEEALVRIVDTADLKPAQKAELFGQMRRAGERGTAPPRTFQEAITRALWTADLPMDAKVKTFAALLDRENQTSGTRQPRQLGNVLEAKIQAAMPDLTRIVNPWLSGPRRDVKAYLKAARELTIGGSGMNEFDLDRIKAVLVDTAPSIEDLARAMRAKAINEAEFSELLSIIETADPAGVEQARKMGILPPAEE